MIVVPTVGASGGSTAIAARSAAQRVGRISRVLEWIRRLAVETSQSTSWALKLAAETKIRPGSNVSR
jgi:hypothetical protein